MAIKPQNPAQPRDTVGEIGRYLDAELATVGATLRRVLESDSALIREVGEYISLASGKKLRPMITLLAARAFGGRKVTPVQVAAAMEAVHVATLLHDDVIDKAPMRRGQPSVNARWGDDVAILMADYLYSSAFELALDHLSPAACRLITQVTRRMCEGEMFQIERRGKWLQPEDYLQIISAKTAYLFSGCAAMGTLSAGLDPEFVTQTASFGMDFGLAFQITDDTLDYTGDAGQLGKAAGSDLVGGKQTLPLILTLQAAEPDDQRRLRAALSEGRDYQFVREMVHRYSAIDQALDMARQYAAQAATHLATLPIQDDIAYEFLTALPDYVLSRRT